MLRAEASTNKLEKRLVVIIVDIVVGTSVDVVLIPQSFLSEDWWKVISKIMAVFF